MNGPPAAASELRCGRRLPALEGWMRKVLRRWLPRPPAPAEALYRCGHRPQLAAVMCPGCARRWLAGRSLWHPWCAVELRHAFDLYFERLQDRP